MCPRTFEGRVATMVYAMLGIPLCMIVLANLGKLMALALQNLQWFLWKLFKYGRKAGQMAGSMTAGAAKGAVGGVTTAIFQGKSKSKTSSLGTCDEHASKPDDRDEVKADETDHILQSDNAESHLMGTDNITPDVASSRDQLSLTKDTDQDGPELHIIQDVEQEPEENGMSLISIIFPTTVVVCYVLAGAWMYSSKENWSFFDSCYFIVVSLSTIGLGDISPTHPKFFIASSIYIFIGLTLVSFVINVILLALKQTIARAQQAPGRILAISKKYTVKKKDVVVEQKQNGCQDENVKVTMADTAESQNML